MGNWKPPQFIRTLAIAIIKNDKKQILLHEGFDAIKNEKFYRPLGGGVEFGERSEATLIREFEEEIDQKIQIIQRLHTLENIFTFEGTLGHEIVLVYEARLLSLPSQETYNIVESGRIVAQAVWRSLAEIRSENVNLYPPGIEMFI